jgi:hypothetical protein
LEGQEQKEEPPVSPEEGAVEFQDNYLEAKEPAELVFCIILAAAYAGLARYCWNLQDSGEWKMFFNTEGFFITISLLAVALGLRPYLNPCNLQINARGVKYRGPHWPRRRTVNWEQMYRLYISPSLIIALYHPANKPRGMRFLILQTGYLADRDKIVDSFIKFTKIEPVFISGPDWITRGVMIFLYAIVIAWILVMLLR